MKLILAILGDLIQLRSPFKTRDVLDFAMALAQWVFLLVLSLTITGVLLALAAQ